MKTITKKFYFGYSGDDFIDDVFERGDEAEFEIPANFQKYQKLVKDTPEINLIKLDAYFDYDIINDEAEYNQYKYCELIVTEYSLKVKVYSKYDAQDTLVFEENLNEQ